jgi:hypothetical protein
MRAARAVLATGAAVVTLAGVAACGGSSSGSSSASGAPASRSAAKAPASPAQAVALAASVAHRSGSAHITGTIQLSMGGAAASGGSKAPGVRMAPMNLRVVADEQWAPTIRMRMRMTGLAIPGAAGSAITELVVGSRVYARVPGGAAQLGKPWVTMDLRRLGQRSGLDLGQILDQAQQLDPAQRVELLRQSGDLRRVGTATVDGVQTTHYAGTVDVAKLLQRERPGSTTSSGQALRRAGITTEHIDVWIDGASRLRRERATMRGATFAMVTDLRMTRYGERVSVTPPPASQTIDLSSFLEGAAPQT